MSDPDREHCLAKIEAIVADGDDSRRALLQLGYNLGRLSELTGLGRGPFWDAWKEPASAWDLPALARAAVETRRQVESLAADGSDASQAPRE